MGDDFLRFVEKVLNWPDNAGEEHGERLLCALIVGGGCAAVAVGWIA